jgi:diamine N-acetyltransferase
MAITLRAITRDNLSQCLRLSTTEEQKNFVAPNVRSIAEAYVEPTFVPLAIYADDMLVGFVMYGRDPQTGFDWVIRLMIDAQHQGQGYGRAAMHEVLVRIRQQPECKEIRISYEPENTIAEQLYRSMGFEPTGEIEEGEVVARLAVAH